MAKKSKPEVVKEQEALQDGMVSLFNRGARMFITSVGKLLPNKKVTVPEKEAATLLKYVEIIETGKIPAKETRTVTQLRGENDRLIAELEEANAKLAAASGSKE